MKSGISCSICKRELPVGSEIGVINLGHITDVNYIDDHEPYHVVMCPDCNANIMRYATNEANRERLLAAAMRIAAARGEKPYSPLTSLRKLLIQERRDWTRPGAPRVGWKRGEAIEVIMALLGQGNLAEEWGDLAYYLAPTPLWYLYSLLTPHSVIERAVRKFEQRARHEKNVVFFDLETRRSSSEVGGFDRAREMGLSVAVTYNSATAEYHYYTEESVQDLIEELRAADLVVGFNVLAFDYEVLRGYTDYPLEQLPTLDILAEVYRTLGFRLSLDALASATLGLNKSADGLQAIRWWREGKIQELMAYCQKDVDLVRRLYEFGGEHGYLLFRDGQVKVSWGDIPDGPPDDSPDDPPDDSPDDLPDPPDDPLPRDLLHDEIALEISLEWRRACS